VVTYDGCTGRSGCPPPTIGVGAVSSSDQLLIYPNPSNGEVHFVSDIPGEKSIEVYDSAGRLIARYKCAGANCTINLDGPSGIYFITLENSSFSSAKKVFVN
jgi:hypothetical protein